jgi:hypothetical protein
MPLNASDHGFSIAGQLPRDGEPRWSRNYWRAKEEGRLADALNIAYEHADDFEWADDFPADWSAGDIECHALSKGGQKR